jgi:hypothetical protein
MLFIVATQQWVVTTFNIRLDITSKIKSFKQRILYKKNLSSKGVKDVETDTENQ